MLYSYLNTQKGFMICQWVTLAQWIYSLSLVAPWGFSPQYPVRQSGAGRELQPLLEQGRHPREHRAVTPSLSFPNTQNHVSFQPTSQHFNIISLKAVCAQGLLCMKKTWTSAEGTDSQIASEEESEVLTLFILSSEISALADWHFSCWEKINEEKISWRKIDGDQTNH